jgi:hypothetical protein
MHLTSSHACQIIGIFASLTLKKEIKLSLSLKCNDEQTSLRKGYRGKLFISDSYVPPSHSTLR